MAIADTKRIKQAQFAEYFSINLQSPIYKPLIEEIQKGVQHGVFALHMHGMEHYWPKALLTVATHDDNVNNWLLSEGFAETEALPSHLQARWTDASKLPSSTIPEPEIEIAIDQEASLFNACFNLQPRVAVATTFVWTEAVEAAWAKAGIDVVITPGARYTCRGSKGEPAGIDKHMLNGEFSRFRQVYLVRNVYFEPSLGHTPQQLAVDAKEQTFFGRPILVEMHRFNFIGDDNKNKSSLLALKTALELMQESFTNLRFLTSLELADAMRNKTSSLIECSLTSRLRIWLRRIKQLRGFSKLSRISGFALPLWLLALLVKA